MLECTNYHCKLAFTSSVIVQNDFPDSLVEAGTRARRK